MSCELGFPLTCGSQSHFLDHETQVIKKNAN